MHFSCLIPESMVSVIAEADSSASGKYTEWIVRQVKSGRLVCRQISDVEYDFEDHDKVEKLLTYFQKLENNPYFTGSHDINDYKSYGDLAQTIEDFKNQRISQKTQKAVTQAQGVIVNRSPYVVVKVTTYEAMKRIARDTHWCVTSFRYFNEYKIGEANPFYIVLKNGEPYVAVFPSSGDLKDKYDRSISKQIADELEPVFDEMKKQGIEFPARDDFLVTMSREEVLRTGDAKIICQYAFDVIQGRFPEAEPVIAKSLQWAYDYAESIIKGRFPEAEPVIAKSPRYAYYYASYVINRRFPEAEPAIAKSPQWAYDYARDVVKGRFPEAESVIARDPSWAHSYARNAIKGRFPEAEPTIAKHPQYAYYYAKNVIKGRFPEAESVIAKSPRWAYNYARDIIKGRFPEAEPVIVKSPRWAYYYARDIIKGRFPEAEPAIAKSPQWA